MNIQSQRERPKHWSGMVNIENDVITWHNIDLVFARIKLDQIVAIGEYANSSGPWFDDWFISLIKKDGKWVDISWYADNIEELTQYLSNKLQLNLNVSCLTNSTVWKSVVRYPRDLEGKPLFKLLPGKNFKEPKSFIGKFLSSLGLGNFDMTKEIHLSDDIEKLLNY